MQTLRRFLVPAALSLAGNASSGQVPATIPAAKPDCQRLPALDSVLLMSDVFRLAADSMKGRRVGSPENAKARAFIGARFDALGLATLGSGRFAPFTVAGRAGRGAAPGAAPPPPIQGTNIIGLLKGTKFPDQYIVISAHYDHIGYVGAGQCRAAGADSICNGADDNASGTAALLNLAKYFTAQKPEHSIIFASFDAEESGDVGSRAWVDSMPVAPEKVLIDVNMDMIGRNAKNELYATGTAKYPHLKPFMTGIIACAPITLIAGHDGETGKDDWTNQSDQGAFHRKGIPFIYFGEEDHPDYHRAGDSPDRLMPAFYVSSARIVADFVRQFDEHPQVKPK